MSDEKLLTPAERARRRDEVERALERIFENIAALPLEQQDQALSDLNEMVERLLIMPEEPDRLM
jgi:F0F1-type ATP synthase membrane subunit b/b'